MTDSHGAGSLSGDPATTGPPGAAGPGPNRPPGQPGGFGAASLRTERGSTIIAAGVVAKIAGMATREIPGVQSLGAAGAQRLTGPLRSRVPSALPEVNAGTGTGSGQGVSVDVNERDAAVDLQIVTYYGQSIVDVTEAVRQNVISRVEAMTGLNVTEVNITVNDLYVEGPPTTEIDLTELRDR